MGADVLESHFQVALSTTFNVHELCQRLTSFRILRLCLNPKLRVLVSLIIPTVPNNTISTPITYDPRTTP